MGLHGEELETILRPLLEMQSFSFYGRDAEHCFFLIRVSIFDKILLNLTRLITIESCKNFKQIWEI